MRLGLKSKVLIGVMALGLVGTVGSTLALTRNGAAGAGNPGAFDQAVYLYWGNEASTASIANVENLAASVTQYRGLEVSPQTTKSVAGSVRLTFTLEKAEGNHHIEGLTVKVYKIDAAFDAEHASEQIAGKAAAPVLDKNTLTGYTDLPVVASSNAHTTTGHYAIQIFWDGSIDEAAGHESYALGASVTISQSFLAA